MNVKTDSKITKNTKGAQTEEMEQNIHKTKQTKKKFSLVCVVQVLLCMGPVLKCSWYIEYHPIVENCHNREERG